MDNLIEKHNIDVLDFAKKSKPDNPVGSHEHSQNVQSQGNRNYALRARVKPFSQLSNID